jgi:hypothetical protein
MNKDKVKENEDYESTIICKRVKLLKKLTKCTDSKTTIGYYNFIVESKNYNILEIEIIFNDYENIEIEEKYDPNKEFKILTRIDPLETKQIAKIILKNKWKFKYIEKICTIAPPKFLQENFIRKDVIQMEKDFKEFEIFYEKNKLNLLEAKQIEKILLEKNLKYIDFDFPANYNSIFKSNVDYSINDFDYVVHWRRPESFALEQEEDAKEINDKDKDKEKDKDKDNTLRVFNKYEPEPNEICVGFFPETYLVSAVSAIAEKNDLISKLFKSKIYSKSGIYELNLCFMGEWVSVIIDDFFPCKPMSEPLCCKSQGNELWLLILEKAVAKLHEYYFFQLALGICDFFTLFTGMPTEMIDIKEYLNNTDKSRLFRFISNIMKNYNLIVALTLSNFEATQMTKSGIENESLLIPGMGYTLLKIDTRNETITLRKIWYDSVKDERIKNLDKDNKGINKIEDREKGLVYLCKII